MERTLSLLLRRAISKESLAENRSILSLLKIMGSSRVNVCKSLNDPEEDISLMLLPLLLLLMLIGSPPTVVTSASIPSGRGVESLRGNRVWYLLLSNNEWRLPGRPFSRKWEESRKVGGGALGFWKSDPPWLIERTLSLPSLDTSLCTNCWSAWTSSLWWIDLISVFCSYSVTCCLIYLY